MKLTIDVESTKDPSDCFESNINAQKIAIQNAKTQKDKFILLGTMSLLLKLSIELEKKLNED